MEQPLINIITRASRKNSIKRSVDSVLEQSYKNIHHIITYETNEMEEYLQTITNPEITTLVKVPHYKQIDGLCMSYMHHDHYSNWLEPNWEFLDRKVHLSVEGIEKNQTPVEPVKYQKYLGDGAVAWCTSLDYATRKIMVHFPPNLYLKIAEGYLGNGWVIYLDDDDVLYNNKTLERITNELDDEDVLYFIKITSGRDVTPTSKHWEYMKIGYPPVWGEIGGCNFIFHSKYSKYTVWDEWRGADYRTANALHRIIPRKEFIEDILVSLN